jgi:N-acetylmuramoyl-L-alanine amidase
MNKPLLLPLLCTLFLLTESPTLAQQPPSFVNRPVLRLGSQGTEVTNLQATLKLLGYYTGPIDGVYSESTVIAVFLFQQAANLDTTGIVDAATWTALLPTVTPPPPVSTAPTSDNPNSMPTLRVGMNGSAVRLLQERLRALGLSVTVDGVFGEQTLQAVMAAQQQLKLNPDGVVGPATWQALLGQ